MLGGPEQWVSDTLGAVKKEEGGEVVREKVVGVTHI